MSGKTPHIVRTALQNRQKIILSARVIQTQRISPTVKGLLLNVEGSERCDFKAGQWLDLFVPDVSHIGGFSMCSPPHELIDKGTIQLAVKASPNPVAKWIHEKCSIGNQVRLRFGGEFFYDPESDLENHSICLIAGGVGANPLVSILLETLHFDAQKGLKRCIVLLQSAKREEELLFEEKTKALMKNHPTFLRSLFVTEPNVNSEIKNGRISEADLRDAVERCGEKAKYFICGPPSMIDETRDSLLKFGVPQEMIFFEKWS